jgi:membrane protein YdbS with pleckstrin-like domain
MNPANDHGAPEMWLSRLLAGLVTLLVVIAAIGSLAVLVLNTLAPNAVAVLATVAVLALVVVALVGMSALGARSRRWLSNPYW